MSKQTLLKKNTLVAAVGIAVMGGLSGCSSDSGGGAAAAAFAILMNGGTGGNTGFSSGGSGGQVNLYNDGASGGVEVRNSGSANTSFTTPVQPGNPDLGDNPLDITSDTTLVTYNDNTEYADGDLTVFSAGDVYLGDDGVFRTSAGGSVNFAADAAVADGTTYIRSSDDRIASIDAADAANHSVYTGLSVAEDTILTLAGTNGSGNADLRVNSDIDNNGTITNVDGDTGGGSIYLVANKYYGGNIFTGGIDAENNGGDVTIDAAEGIVNDGSIDTSGFDEVDANGGSGGNISLYAGGYVLNNGQLNASGGDTGADNNGGGWGGSVRMYAAYTENNGAVDTSGGSGLREAELADGEGGNAGAVCIQAEYVANNTAAITAVGGNGAEGGTGALVAIGNEVVGEAKNAGDIDISGGSSTEYNFGGSTGYNCSGDIFFAKEASGFSAFVDTAGGGQFSMAAFGGSAINNANIVANGGVAEGDFAAGNAGRMTFDSYHGRNNDAPGDVSVSGNLTANGGNAAADGAGYGGSAGSIRLAVNLDEEDSENESINFSNQKAVLYGYESIDLNGGDGGGNGGSGGSFNLFADYMKDKATARTVAGSALNQVPVNANGGNSTANTQDPAITGYGGYGGYVSIRTTESDSVSGLNIGASNTADVSVMGGNAPGVADPDGLEPAFGNGASGGRFDLFGYSRADNGGNVAANAGTGGRYGGWGGYSWIETISGPATNRGDVNVSGGDGGMEGRNAGWFELFGKTSSNSGDIAANGGNATGPLTEGLDPAPEERGGDGGYIGITAQGLTGATNAGALSVAEGTGSTENGEEGCTQVNYDFDGNCTGFFDD